MRAAQIGYYKIIWYPNQYLQYRLAGNRLLTLPGGLRYDTIPLDMDITQNLTQNTINDKTAISRLLGLK